MIKPILFILFVLLTIASVNAEPVLVEVIQPGCGPCNRIKPAVARLKEDGYVVSVVDIAQGSQRVYFSDDTFWEATGDEFKIAFNVKTTPTFIVVDNADKPKIVNKRNDILNGDGLRKYVRDQNVKVKSE